MGNPYFLRCYLVRHGPVEKVKGCLPAYDAELSSHQKQLHALKDHLPDDGEWHCSPLMRARQSYEILNPDGGEPSIDTRLEEQNFGSWHERPMAEVWDDISQRMSPTHPVSFINYDDCPPGGTSFDDVYQKAGAFLDELVAKRSEKPQMIISHAGTSKALLGHMLGLSPAQAMMIEISHGSVSVADYIYDTQKPDEISPWQIQFINRLYGA